VETMLRKLKRSLKKPIFPISAATGKGMRELLFETLRLLK